MAIAQTDTLTPLINLASLFLGKSGTSSTTGGSSSEKGTITNTVNESVPQAAVDAAIKSILEGTQGLAAVTSGQKVAGLYNSSTNTLLANDLVARAAAQGAALNKTTTTTQARDITTTREPTVTSQVSNPQISPTTGLGILGALQVLPTLKDSIGGILAKKKFNIDEFDDTEPGGNVTTGSGIDTATSIPAVAASDSFSSPAIDVASIAQSTGLDEGLLNAGSSLVDAGTTSAIELGTTIGGDILGGFDATDWLNNSFNNFEFARGGLVKGYAEGGEVSDGKDRRETKTYQPTVADHLLGLPIRALLSLLASSKEADIRDSSGRNKAINDPRVPAETRLASRSGLSIGASDQVALNVINDILAGNSLIYDKLKDLPNFLQPFPHDPGSIGNVFPRGYAEGGQVVGPNTGLRPTPAKSRMKLAPESNFVIDDALQSAVAQLTPSIVTPSVSTPKATASSTSKRIVKPASQTSAEAASGTSSGPATGTTPGASNSGLDVSTAALSGINTLAGISAPGLAGLATAPNNASAANSFMAANTGLVGGLALGLPGALIAALLSKSMFNQLNPAAAASNPSDVGPVGDPVEGSVAVSNPSGGMQSSTPGMLDAIGLLGMIANQSINPGIGQASISGGGLSAESGGSVSDSSGASVGTDGDGGIGAGAAMQSGGKVPGDDPTHSDMVPAKLTNGEFVVNRNATKQFLPILEIINSMIPATPTPSNPLGAR